MPLAFPGLVFLVALVYSMVGHGGASGYIALGILFSLPLEGLRTQALMLNLFVAGLSAVAFFRAGHFRKSLLLPLLAGSVPAAFLGARMDVGTLLAKKVLGVTLALAAANFLFRAWLERKAPKESTRTVSWPVLVAAGAALGLLSGWTGVGGGIYLSPLLLMLGMATVRETSAVSAGFIFVNSASGLAGILLKQPAGTGLPLVWVGAAVVGGALGSTLGSRHLSVPALRLILGLVLVLAAYKLLS